MIWQIYIFISAYREDVEINRPDTPTKEESDLVDRVRIKKERKGKSKVKSEPKSPIKSEQKMPRVKSEQKTPRAKAKLKTPPPQAESDLEEPWTDTILASGRKRLFTNPLGPYSPESE